MSAAGAALWYLNSEGEQREATAGRLIGLSFWALAAWVGYHAVTDLAAGHRPDVSAVGIVLTTLSVLVMPALARAKRRTGDALSSTALVAESNQTMVCVYLSVAVLLGLGLNAAFGWWWADPAAALVVGAIAIREGRVGLAWRTARRRRLLLMDALALIFYVVFFIAAFGWRTWLQWRRTGDTGLRVHAEPGTVQWRAKLAFVLAAGVAAPLAGLALRDPLDALDIAGIRAFGVVVALPGSGRPSLPSGLWGRHGGSVSMPRNEPVSSPRACSATSATRSSPL